MPPETPLMYRVVLAILGLLFLHIKLSVVLSRPVKNYSGILIGNCVESVDCFWQDCHFYCVDPNYPRTWEILPFSGIFFNFFL